MNTSYHMVVSIKGARARLTDPQDRNMAKRILGVNTVAAARAMLDQAEAEGLEVIPFEDRDKHSASGHCLGHPTSTTNQETKEE